MHSTLAFGVSAITLVSLIQLCPAPPVVTAAAITAGGAIVGGAISTAGKRDVVMAERLKARQADLPPGVPQFEYDRCVEDLGTSNIVVSGPVENNGIRAEGVPPTCMTLATVLVGNPVDGPVPTPCGSACLLYNDLTDAEFNELRGILGM